MDIDIFTLFPQWFDWLREQRHVANVLAAGSRTVMLRNDIDWHETEKLLKLAFPLDVFARETLAETQFGFQRRVTHVNTSWEAAKFETSMHRFVLAQEDDGFGVALVNDSIYGFDTSRDVDGDNVTTTGSAVAAARSALPRPGHRPRSPRDRGGSGDRSGCRGRHGCGHPPQRPGDPRARRE